MKSRHPKWCDVQVQTLESAEIVLTLENSLYMRIEQLPSGVPTPLPLSNGFNTNTAYRALGMFNPSETSDAYFIFSNDRDEVWFICNRHLRCVGLLPGWTALRMSIGTAEERIRLAIRQGEVCQ